MITKILAVVNSSASWVDRVALLSLLLMAPLLLFPYGALPFVALGMALVMSLWRWAARGGPKIRVEDVPLLILLGMALLGYGISIERALSWPRLCSILLGLIIFVELRRALHPREWATWIALGLILVGLGMAGISLVGTDWGQVRMFDLPWLYDRLPTLVRGLPDSGALKNASDLFGPRWVGIIMGVLAPVYLPMLAWRERSWLRWLAAGAFLLVTLTLLLTQSLQGLIGLLAGMTVVLLCVSCWFWLLVPVGLAALAGLHPSIDLAKVGTMLLSIDNAAGIAVVLRLDMWSRAWAMIRDLPLTGIGLNTFPLIQSQFYPGIFIGPEAHSHNLYLQLALDLGLPGLFAFVWFVILWIVRLLRQLAKEPTSNDRLLLISALAGVVAYLAHGIMDAQMPGAKPGFVIWSLLGIGAALTAPLAQDKKEKVGSWVLSCLALPVMIGLFALWKPAAIYMNLGAVQAHSLLSPFPTAHITAAADLDTARKNLEEARRLDPSRAQAHLLLGRIASLQGDFSAAKQHYEGRVTLDMDDPVATYNPALQLRLLITSESHPDAATELWKIYHAWNTRFPDRAEGYLLKSILASKYQSNPSTGTNLLKMGIEAGALPPGLLEYVLSLE